MKKLFVLTMLSLLLTACATGEPKRSSRPAASNRDRYLQQQGNFKIGKPYTVLGQTYIPKEQYEYLETGIASWYGPGFHGSRTASGEKYDQREMTAAHRTLQMPSLVKVTNLGNGRSVIVRVNDRGPFSKGRVMDVSELAATRLGMIGPGTAKVKLELLQEESKTIAAAAKAGVKTNGVEVIMNETGRLPESYNRYASRSPIAVQQYTPLPEISANAYAPTQAGMVPGHVKSGSFYPEPLVTQEPVAPNNIFIQAGAFGSRENAERLASRLEAYATAQVEPVEYNNRTLYRVKLGPLDSVPVADNVLLQVLTSGQSDAIIVVQ